MPFDVDCPETLQNLLQNHNKTDTLLQFFHSVKPSTRDRLELMSKFNDIF
jgi:hypothetical protein